MEHHICKGTCGAVSEHSSTCSTDGCTHSGKTFEQCDCGNMSSAHKKDEAMNTHVSDNVVDEEDDG